MNTKQIINRYNNSIIKQLKIEQADVTIASDDGERLEIHKEYEILIEKFREILEIATTKFMALHQFKIWRSSEDIQLPQRMTEGAAGYDFYSPVDAIIQPNHKIVIDTGIGVVIPPSTVFKIFPRSSMGIKHGVVLANTVGIIDSDYTTKTIKVCLHNTGNETIEINKGDRFCQGILEPILLLNPVEIKQEEAPEGRQGESGHTGK